MREIVLDTETTGLSPAQGDRLVEIGCVELVNRFVTGRHYHTYINPHRDMPPGAFAVHGLSAEFLADKPSFSAVTADFLAFIGDDPLVIHNADFDMGFINAELERAGLTALPSDRAVNTLILARRKHPGVSNRLDDLCQRYGIDNSRRTKHGALLDAELLAEVYIELIGGRQTSMSLDSGPVSDRELSSTRQPRPAAAIRLLTQEELAAHATFIATLGEKALWKKYTD